jgi:hypothetical protein
MTKFEDWAPHEVYRRQGAASQSGFRSLGGCPRLSGGCRGGGNGIAGLDRVD